MNIRSRLTLGYAATLGVLLLAFAVGICFFVERSLTRQLEQALADQSKLVTTTLTDEHEDLAENLEELAQREAVPCFEVREGELVLYRSPAWTRAGLDVPATTSQSRRDLRVHRSGTSVAEKQYGIAVAIDGRLLRRTLTTLATILTVGLPLGFVAALLGGYLLAGRALAPVQIITAKTREITAERLAERLPMFRTGDELDRLAGVINELLARLEGSFVRLRQFTADASHELRTPLTAIRTVGEVALQEDATGVDQPADALRAGCRRYREAIGSMLEETNRLTQLLEDLLTLTRADVNRDVLAKERIALAAVAAEAIELVRPLAEEKTLRLDVRLDQDAAAIADFGTLRQAVLNLLDNAIKYTPAGGTIGLRVQRRAGAAVLEVTDTGPGIAPEHQARVFERFYRVDPSRSVQRGAGLGLSIAQWAVAANGGRIELESDIGRGTTLRVVLPASDE